MHWENKKQGTDIFALEKSSTSDILGTGFLLYFLQSNFPLLIISRKQLFLNVMGNLTKISL